MHLTLRDTTIKRTIDEVLEGKKMQTESYIDDFYLLNNDELKARFAAAKDRDEEIFLRYLYEQKKCFGLDFNDLINFASYILKNFPDIRAKWQDRMFGVVQPEVASFFKMEIPSYEDYAEAAIRPIAEHYDSYQPEQRPVLFTEPGTDLDNRYVTMRTSSTCGRLSSRPTRSG